MFSRHSMSALYRACEVSSRFSGHSMSVILQFSTMQTKNRSKSPTTGDLSTTANSGWFYIVIIVVLMLITVVIATFFAFFSKVGNFDICWSGSKSSVGWEPFDRAQNWEIWNGEENTVEGVSQVRVLRPGMVLLKHYINHDEQVGIIRSCQKLGLGPGGFYKLGNHGRHLMGLGLTWDPKTQVYENWRSVDGCKTHDIPEDYILLVKGSIRDAHAHLKDLNVTNVEDILPSMSPSVCIVNFYTTIGRLALHQDRSESKESLRKGLPIVSFSLGDSAEFVYVDVHERKKVILESGDVLMFGGKSRHVYHGVNSIIPNSAPIQLLEESRLRPGRLNLTFREL